MEEEHTADYREPCGQCSAVDWGISDECRFFCRSCHNIIERTTEVLDPSFMTGPSRVTTFGRRSRHKKTEHSGRQWMVCEGFQFILMNQADTLLRLGVRQQFKDQVLCELWRLYLQQSDQAFTYTPVRSAKLKLRRPGSDSESAPESSIMSASETDLETNPSSTGGSDQDSISDWLACSGSVDATSYLSSKRRRGHSLLSMTKTLALIHIALTWSREPLTLSDLLRLVNEGHVPYINAYEALPEEMKLEGKDSLIFRVESVPSHRAVHEQAQSLILFLKLPAFPPISLESLLHPALLSLRFLTDANLPDDLHPWLCKLMERAGMADQKLHTFSPESCPVLPKYDVQTAALVIITMKLFFGLDDHTEWDSSNEESDQEDSGDVFSLRRWYELLQAALIRAQNRRDQDTARRQWRSKKLLYMNKKDKYPVMKQKRIAEQLQFSFEKLSSCPAVAEPVGPSSFRFCWGDEDGADGPSMHHEKLAGVVTTKNNKRTLFNPTYWHRDVRPSRTRDGRCHFSEVEPTLPQTFVWLLQLFGFLLDVKPAYLYEEVLSVERLVFSCELSRGQKKRTRTRTRTRAEPRTRRKAPCRLLRRK